MWGQLLPEPLTAHLAVTGYLADVTPSPSRPFALYVVDCHPLGFSSGDISWRGPICHVSWLRAALALLVDT